MEVEKDILESLHDLERRLDERLDAVAKQVARAQGQAARNRDLLERIDREIACILVAINGNGSLGIKARLAQVENAVSRRLLGLDPKLILVLLLAPYAVISAGVLLLGAASGVDLADVLAKIVNLF